MDREKLFRYLDRQYCSKRDLLSRIPLGVQPDTLWQDLLNLRRSRSTTLPLYGHTGFPYWYVTTEKMISASEKIIEALMEYETETGAAVEAPSVSTLEEVFYTSFVEGAQITMQEAMDFLAGDLPPRSIEEQMIVNNRMAGSYAGAILYRSIDPALLQELTFLLTDGMDNGGQEFRTTADVDYASADEEAFEFPGPHVLQECVKELCAYLADRTVHPLIKAAVAQAYVFVIRPFPEGNERLGRVLSSMILLRAGYGFFSDVSLSALIARKSYAYYEAMANILRAENGSDMTYFMEFFLELLSRAVDERRLRIRQREEQARQVEMELARTVLVPPPVLAPIPEHKEAELSVKEAEETVTAPAEPEEQALPELSAEEDDPLNGFSPVSELFAISDGALTEDEDATVEEALSLVRVHDVLYELTESDGDLIKNGALVLLRLLDSGVETFSAEELRDELGISSKQAGYILAQMRERGVVERSDARNNRCTVYRFKTKFPPLMPRDYDPEVINRVKDLISSRSPKDKRIGEIISGCMAKGMITLADYGGIGDGDKMGGDMLLPLRMGLLTKYAPCVYRINRAIPEGAPTISVGQKEILTSLYKRFGNEGFTVEEATAIFSISKSAVSAHLHQFVMLRIMECTGAWTFVYRILTTPEEHPELFTSQESMAEATQEEVPPEEPQIESPGNGYTKDVYDLLNKLEASVTSNKDRRVASSLRLCLNKALVLESDYEKWGYTHKMWRYDMKLASDLGLVRKLAPDAYAINKRLHPTLQPQQKKTVSAIYETFGDQEFSPEMFIATLNYSPSYSYVSLHRLTLLRILDQRSTEDGSQYQLLVNPEDHPECFDTAA